MNSIIQTPTPQLTKSLAFYTALGFQQFTIENTTFISDGKAVIEINSERFARAGIKLYRANWKPLIGELQKLTTVQKLENGYLLSDPSGAWIYLLHQEHGIAIDVTAVSASSLGNFAGVSLETTDMEKSLAIWQLLGFQHSMGALEQGWIVVSNQDGLGISLMKPFSCPHLFFSPSLTYFNGKNNLEVIAKIRAASIPITEEITHFNKEGIVDNVILRDPGGFGFFIFSD